ncbi:MAG: TonB-dependent receptor [Flavobacteriaceae bacterium]|jgi:iron complex outermembrane recepter protein|nr:TonB-dependent receptor [Flavobacteriaceae bacterium]MDG1921065.1 TonB-dependent receptor [Flavobacteriaceae bacterium]
MKSIRLSFFLFLNVSVLLAQEPNAQTVKDSLTTISLEEVLLTGIRAKEDIPVTFTNLSRQDLAPRNLGQDIPILLNYLPGVVTTSDAGAGIGYTGIRVRGTDATRVNVTINGIPYNDSESQGTFWVNLPDFASSVEAIQLQRGVGTSTNGSAAFGASLNLETDAVQEQAYATLASSLGSFNSIKNTLRFSSGILNEGFTLSGRLSQINSEGYVDRAASNLDAYYFQGTFKDETTLIKALVFGGQEITYQSWYGLNPDTLKNNRRYNPAGEVYDTEGNRIAFYENQVDNYAQEHYQFHWNERLNSKWNIALGLNYTHGSGFYEEYNDLWYDQNISFSGATSFDYLQLKPFSIGNTTISDSENISQKWLDNDYYVITLGLNYNTEGTSLNFGGLYSYYVGDHFGDLIWGQNLGEVLPNHRFYENQGIKKEGSFFAKATQTLSEGFTGFIDLQLRSIGYQVSGQIAGPASFSVDDNFVFFNPKAGLTYDVASGQKLYFSYAKAQREPNRTDYENGNPKPEKLDDFELGWRINTPKLQAQTNVYWMEYKDQLVLTGAIDAVGSPIRQNVGKSRRIGIELEFKINLNSNWLWQPNIALSSNQNLDFYFKRDGVLENLGKTQLAYSPNLVGGNAIMYVPSTRFQIGLLSKYVGKQYMGNIDSENSTLSAYFVNDLSAVYTWQPNKWIQEIQWSLLVNNIFNAQYESNGYFYTFDDTWSALGQVTTVEGAGYYPQAGINFLTGVMLRF